MSKPSDESKRQHDGLHKRHEAPGRKGIWYYSLTINGKRRFFSTKTRGYMEARKVYANAKRDQLENKLPTDAAKWKFETLLARVIEDRRPHLAENSRRIDKERSGPLLKHFSGKRVLEINALAIRGYQTARLKQVSPRTVNLEGKLLRHILKAAKIWAIVADDYKALKEDRRGPGRAIEESQEKLLFDTARSKPGWDAALYAAIVAANTGMRGCEVKGLHIADVNLIDREVSIGKSKTDTGVRRIPLNDGALWGFARLLERAHALGATKPDHFLLPRFRYRETKTAAHGTGYDPTQPQKTWRTAWRSLVKETTKRAAEGITDEGERQKAMAPFIGLRYHDARHGMITKLAESEASDQTIMAIAGHMDRSMLEHYSHIRAAAKRKAVDAIRSYIPEEKRATTTTRSVQ